MNCPKCPGKLEKKTVERYEVDVCPMCEGIWFDIGELESIIKADSRDFNKIDLDRDSLDGQELSEVYDIMNTKIGKCPRCADGTEMVRAHYKKEKELYIDVCPNCKGIWLDGGEINRLRDRGLVDLKDRIDIYLSSIRWIWSKDGFNAFRRKMFGKDKKA